MMMIKRMTSNNSIITRLYMILWMTKIYIPLFRTQRIPCKNLRYEMRSQRYNFCAIGNEEAT